MRQGYRWYANPSDGKSQNVVGSTKTVDPPQLNINIADDLYKITNHVYNWKVGR